MLVSDYMTKSPVTIAQDADYNVAFEIMDTENLHHLPVVDASGHVVGILTRRDLQLAARHFMDAPVEVSEVMHSPVESITATAGLATAARRMTTHRIGCLPVLDRGKRVVGMLTETDIFRALADALAGKVKRKKAAAKASARKKAAAKAPARKKAAARTGARKKPAKKG